MAQPQASSVAPPSAGECPSAAWPLETVRMKLTATDVPVVARGARLAVPMAAAVELRLVPQAEAALPVPPERAAPGSVTAPRAGFVELEVPDGGRTWQVNISDAAWIDVISGGAYVPSGAHTGPRDCPGVRKSVRFVLPAGRTLLQFSGAAVERLRLIVTAVD